jgi:SPP1 gp7 family putative phage head morphogenesis protein
VPDPTTIEGYDEVVGAFAEALRSVATGADKRALRRIERVLRAVADGRRVDVNSAMTEVEQIMSATARTVVGRVTPTLRARVRSIVAAARRFFARRFGLTPSSAAWDRRIVEMVRQSPVAWVLDEYGRRSTDLARIARRTIAEGVDARVSADKIGDALAVDARLVVVNRAESYWQTVAENAAARARSSAHIAAMHVAGVRVLMFEATIDSRTSDICRFMHGRTFAVSDALSHLERLEAVDPSDTERGAATAPFARTITWWDGTIAITVGEGHLMTRLATVARSGVGHEGDTGEYLDVATEAEMVRAGFMYPPCHHRCRSRIVPAR